MAGKIVYSGSCVTAMTMICSRFPMVSETVIAGSFMAETGGKGSNQALTASRLGSDVYLIGCVGDDSFGQSLLQTHIDFGVNIDGVLRHPTTPTGTAFIIVNGDGDNMITVAMGANGEMTAARFDANLHLLEDASLIGFQLEHPVEYVEYGICKAHELGILTLLDPAPAKPISHAVYPCLDFIKPNEVEASLLTGIDVTDGKSAFDAAQWFLDKGVKNAVITLGDQGVVLVNDTISEHIVPPTVAVKDPTAAGDIFCGAFMHGVAEGKDLLDAAQFAVYASALSVQTMGGVDAIPDKDQVLEFIAACQ